MELRALEKGEEDRRYDAWCRARMIAHCVYVYAPVFAKGTHKETDPKKWMPLPGDRAVEEKPVVVHISEDDIKELNRIKNLIR